MIKAVNHHLPRWVVERKILRAGVRSPQVSACSLSLSPRDRGCGGGHRYDPERNSRPDYPLCLAGVPYGCVGVTLSEAGIGRPGRATAAACRIDRKSVV